jgi:hypothetical protein
MGRKKNNKRFKQTTGTKRKKAGVEDDLPHAAKREGVIAHAFASGWVQNSGVAFLVALVALAVSIMTRTQIKAATLTFAFSGTAVLWILAAAIIKYIPQPSFSVVVAGEEGSHFSRYQPEPVIQ